MSETPKPLGRLYSELYQSKADPTNDSEVMRRRVALEVYHTAKGLAEARDFAEYLERETGLKGPLGISPGPNYSDPWIDFFVELDRATCLDNLTRAINYLTKRGSKQSYPSERSRYFEACQYLVDTIARIFSETGVLLQIDRKGGIHPKVDEAFTLQRASVIAGLEGEGFRAAREYVDQCLGSLREQPPDGAEAIRDLFLAAENIFKQIFPDVDRLDQRTVGRKLKPLLSSSPDAQQLASMCAALTQWVNVGQDYRHEDGEPEMNQPSEDLTTLMVSVGFSQVRWLASIRRSIDP